MIQKLLLVVVSWFLVAYGQPALCWSCGLIAAVCGFALFWYATLDIQKPSLRFWLATFWFMAVSWVHLSWFISHPYLYIYVLYTILPLLWGLQFGLITLFVTRSTLRSFWIVPAVAGAWVLMEMSRLYIFSGFSWNPVGIALSGSLYSLQSASLWGVYGMSFWVIFTNLLLLRAYLSKSVSAWLACGTVALFPYLYGAAQIGMHQTGFAAKEEKISTVLVQTAFPIEESMAFATAQDAISFVKNEWKSILTLIKEHQGKKIQLIVLPEYVLPYGTYYPVFKLEDVVGIFREVLGRESLKRLPLLQPHLAGKVETDKGPVWMVDNAFWVQAIADVFDADVVVGLEDRDQIGPKEYQCYSSAFLFVPGGEKIERYEKRILVPMGEYIPFACFRALAASYGIQGSFTCGTEAKCLNCNHIPIGASICYEETYGHLMRENRILGVEMLVNLTNDGWYPHSSLPKQHMEHARLRTVEMGIPLIRSCNTGITGAMDCFGRTLAMIEDEKLEEKPGSLYVEVPRYHYHTPYTLYGDWLVIAVSIVSILLAWVKRTRGT